MANIRDPARDRAYILWKEAGGKKAPKGILKEIAEILNKSVSLIRKWKNLDEWEKNITNKSNGNITNGNGNVNNKKKQIAKAKAMVISGSTIKEASEKTGVSESALQNYSAKEKWIDQQEKFMQEVYKEVQEFYTKQHIEDRKLSVTLLHNLMVRTFSEEKQGTVNIKEIALRESIANLFIKSIKGQSDILGIPEMKMYIRQDKEDKEEKIKDRTINIKVVK